MLYFILFALAITILFAISYTRNIAIKSIPELISATGAYIWLLADVKSDSTDIIISDYTFKEANDTLIILGTLLMFGGIFYGVISKTKNKTCENITEELNVKNIQLKKITDEFFKLCSDQLMNIFSDFFSKSSGLGRVSIYKFDDNKFKLLGRYSENPNYNKRGRNEYPSNEGFISKGWELGEYEINQIPKYVGKGKDWKDFIRKNCNISDNTLRNMTMKSSSYYIYRVNNEDSRHQLGIVVFEQISPIAIDKVNIKNVFNTHEKQITALFKSMKTLI